MDLILSFLQAVFAISMAYLGIHLRLHPPDPKSQKTRIAYKTMFAILGTASIALIVWQGVLRSNSQQKLQADVAAAKEQATQANSQTAKIRADLEIEVARRQQAEKDMTLAIQRTGNDTRTGVAEDIRKSPISVRVDGSQASPVPIKIPNITLTWVPEQSTHDDAKFCNKLVFQADIPVEPVALIVILSAPIKYTHQLIRDPFVGDIRLNKDDSKRLEIAIRKLGGSEILAPDKPISVVACSTEDFKPLILNRAILR